jgi:hypothetical protein
LSGVGEGQSQNHLKVKARRLNRRQTREPAADPQQAPLSLRRFLLSSPHLRPPCPLRRCDSPSTCG